MISTIIKASLEQISTHSEIMKNIGFILIFLFFKLDYFNCSKICSGFLHPKGLSCFPCNWFYECQNLVFDEENCVFKDCFECINKCLKNKDFNYFSIDESECQLTIEDENACKERKAREPQRENKEDAKKRREDAERKRKEAARRVPVSKKTKGNMNFTLIFLILGFVVMVFVGCIFVTRKKANGRSNRVFGRTQTGPSIPPPPSAYQPTINNSQAPASAPLELNINNNYSPNSINNQLIDFDKPPTYAEVTMVNHI